ncbi:hypothetical protein ACT4S2_00285 [Kocuria turfanensis]|uniref:hypothetical protein n=1 Tax=Kocuria turfanensis TaxID=388357 RepID=UPI0040367379
MAIGTGTRAGLDVELLVDPDGPVEAGAHLGVVVRARATADEHAGFDGATVELLRTLRYGYRRGNLYGAMQTAWAEDTVTVDTATLDTAVDRAPDDTSARPDPDEPAVLRAELTVPAGAPGSAEGKLIQVRWAVRLRLPRRGRRDVVRERPVEVRAGAREGIADAHTPPQERSRAYAAMDLDRLSSRTLVPGRPLTGTLRLAALTGVPARSFRVELVLQERVEHGPGAGADPARSPADDGREVETVVSRTVVRGGDIPGGQVREVAFTLPVPDRLPAPTLRLPGLRIRWALRAVIDVPWRPDPALTLPLHAPAVSAPGTGGAAV